MVWVLGYKKVAPFGNFTKSAVNTTPGVRSPIILARIWVAPLRVHFRANVRGTLNTLKALSAKNCSVNTGRPFSKNDVLLEIYFVRSLL
jgi:hypothetical protein